MGYTFRPTFRPAWLLFRPIGLAFRPRWFIFTNMDIHTTEPGEHSEFYLLVREITERLVGCRGVEIDTAIDDCLKMIGNYFSASQVGLGQWSKSGQILPSLRAWGPKPVGDCLASDGPGVEAFAYLCRNGSIVWNCLEDLDELPQLQEHSRRVSAMVGAFWLHRKFETYTHQVSRHAVGRHWRITASRRKCPRNGQKKNLVSSMTPRSGFAISTGISATAISISGWPT